MGVYLFPYVSRQGGGGSPAEAAAIVHLIPELRHVVVDPLSSMSHTKSVSHSFPFQYALSPCVSSTLFRSLDPPSMMNLRIFFLRYELTTATHPPLLFPCRRLNSDTLAISYEILSFHD